jgi:hypothetical protein
MLCSPAVEESRFSSWPDCVDLTKDLPMTEPALRPEAPASEPVLRTAPPRFSWPVDWLCRRMFDAIRIAPSAVEHVQELARRGTVVYIMRERSWVDYLLVTYVLRREGLPVPEFVNDVSMAWLRPTASCAVCAQAAGQPLEVVQVLVVPDRGSQVRCR